MTQHFYVSGPMRDHDGFNFPAFFAAEAAIRDMFPNADICNPAREDVVRHNLHHLLTMDPTGLACGRHLQQSGEFTHEDLRMALGRDLDYIAHHATAVVVLPGWEGSKGALCEVATANALGVPVLPIENMPRKDAEAPRVEDEAESKSVEVEHHWAYDEERETFPDLSPNRTMYRKPSGNTCEPAGVISESTPSPGGPGEIRLTSATGGQKGTKLAAFDQISPEVERLVAEHFGKGARKYDAHNFRKGYPWSLSYSALRRHLADFWSGKERDTCSSSGNLGCLHVRDGVQYEGEADTCWNHTGSLHIVAVIWHAMVLTEFYLHQKEYDDRYVYDAA